MKREIPILLGIIGILFVSGCTNSIDTVGRIGSCSFETAVDRITDELAISRGECIEICSDYWQGTGKSDPEYGPMGYYFCNCYTCDSKFKDYYKEDVPSSSVEICSPNYECADWEECVINPDFPDVSFRFRGCFDSNRCGNEVKFEGYASDIIREIAEEVCENNQSNAFCQDNVMIVSERCELEKIREWVTVKEFSGVNNKVTDTFTIKGDKWRFTWECVEDTRYGTGFGGMNIFATPVESDYSLIGESVFMGKCEDPDTTYVYEGPGEYYFDIDVANVISWSVIVEDYY